MSTQPYITTAITMLLVTLSIVLVDSSEANAQGRSKFAVEVRLGLAVPFKDYVKDTTVLVSEDNNPRIVDLTNDPTLGNGSLILDIRDLELSLSLRVFPWGDSIIRYKGDSEAKELAEGDIDDAGVNYEKLDPAQETDENLVSSGGLVLFTAGIGQRFYIFESGLFEAYIPASGGLAFAQVTPATGYNTGLYLAGGAAADVIISDLISVVLDGRVHGVFTENAGGVGQGAQNAVATDATILDALISTMFFFTFDIGVRVSID